MSNEKKVPALRFPEFTDELNAHLLGDLATFSKGRGISKSDIDENGDLPCIRYGELYTTYGEVIDEVVSSTNLDPEKLIISKPKDVIVPASGETQIDIATASCVLRGGVALSGDLNIVRSAINGVFLAYYLGSAKKHEIASMAQGNSVVHLYAKQLRTLNLNLPSPPEQQKIATFLAAVDERLRFLEAQREELLRYKEGVMQRIFDRELRFKDGDGEAFPEWEEKRLGEILSFGSGRDYKHLDAGDIPVFGTGGLMTKVNEYLYDGESVGIGRKGTIDKPVLLTGKFWTVDTLFYTHSFEGVFPRFVYLMFQRINWKKYNEASGVPSLSKRTLELIKVVMPAEEEEQKKIISLFDGIESRVRSIELQYSEVQKWKQGLLQNLFI